MNKSKTIILISSFIVILLFCMHSCLYNNHDGKIIYEPHAGGLYTEVLADSRENTTVPWEYIDMFQIAHNDKAFDSTHADSYEYLDIAASVESILCDTMLYPLELDAVTEKEYQIKAKSLFDEMYQDAAVKIQLSTDAKQEVPDDKLYLVMIRIGINTELQCHIFVYYTYRSDISLDCICNVYTIHDESATNKLMAWAEELCLSTLVICN